MLYCSSSSLGRSQVLSEVTLMFILPVLSVSAGREKAQKKHL